MLERNERRRQNEIAKEMPKLKLKEREVRYERASEGATTMRSNQNT